MGKGDRKTKKGKIWMGSFGVTRPRPNASNDSAKPSEAKAKPDTASKSSSTKKTTSAKKTTAKKKTEKADK